MNLGFQSSDNLRRTTLNEDDFTDIKEYIRSKFVCVLYVYTCLYVCVRVCVKKEEFPGFPTIRFSSIFHNDSYGVERNPRSGSTSDTRPLLNRFSREE